MRRVSVTTLRRLDRIEKMRSINRPRAAFPAILSIDEWEALAVPSQEQLVADTRDTFHIEDVVINDLDDVSHRYKW